jgi:uncharacterized membrane protein
MNMVFYALKNLNIKMVKLVNLWIDSMSILRTSIAQVSTFIAYKEIGKLSVDE